MSRINDLETKVQTLYAQKNPNRADWADWLWKGHVLSVARYASEFSGRFDADAELSRAAALTHDIADAKMKRDDPEHGNVSLEIGRSLMRECGFSSRDIAIVIDDAVRYHSCRGNKQPKSTVGKVLATADAVAHFKTDFYEFAKKAFRMPEQEMKKWVLEKIDRDLYKKVFFDEIKKELKPDYDRIKAKFAG